MGNLNVNDTLIKVHTINDNDYLCITDMLKAKDGDFFITDWLRNRNTLEFIGIWEQVYNPDFNCGEFATIKSKSGLNNFKIGVQEFVEKTGAISLQSKSGHYGGTYAHKDIAFEFGMWISPEFKVYLIKEFQRLKEEESKLLGWTAKRELAKINYRIHTDAIKENLIPKALTIAECSIIYANEADLLNKALFEMTAKEWKKRNSDKKGNMRDHATLEQLLVLANLENLNAEFIKMSLSPSERLQRLNAAAISQMISLLSKNETKKLAKISQNLLAAKSTKS